MIVASLALAARLVAPDSAPCVKELRAALASLGRAQQAPRALVLPDTIDVCRRDRRPPPALWRRILTLAEPRVAADTQIVSTVRAALHQTDTVEVSLAVAGLTANLDEPSLDLRNLIARIDTGVAVASNTALDSIRRACRDDRQAITEEVQTCVAGAARAVVRQANHNLLALARLDTLLLATLDQPTASDKPRSARFTISRRLPDLSLVAVATAQHRETARWRDDILWVQEELEKTMDDRPANIVFATGAAQDRVGAGFVRRVSRTAWASETPWILAGAFFPSGAPRRYAAELSVGRMAGNIAMLAGAIVRGSPQPLGASATMLVMTAPRAPVVGIRISTTDPVAVVLGWGFALR